MILGSYILALATVAAVMATVGYFFVARGNYAYAAVSKIAYYLMTGLVIIAGIQLISLFLNNRFEYAYVSGYSSFDLATNYKITSLWAGQEGSFLLWALFGVMLGIWVKFKARDELGWVMFFYLIALLFLFALLNISSPFRLNDVMLFDGRGLNPLLQNYWMQIHPPIVFLGYASTFVPFAFAMAALATNKYDSWVKLTFPWAILSVCTLGAGIFLGGYWAYETLGWGGYWGWDPVENASLVPWLGSIAMVHGMILEKIKGSFRRTNLFLAITTFLMVIYGTFLTRSGVLADFSVHSFVDLGLSGYLIVFLVGFTIISYGLLIIRRRSLKSAESGKSALSREFTVYLGMLFVILSAFLVLLGMSSPLLTRLFGDPSSVDISYYVKTNLPIGIIIGLLLGLSGVLSWGVSSFKELMRKLPVPIILSLLAVLIAIVFGIANFAHLAFIFAAAFALFANLILLIKRFVNHGLRNFEADIIHTGVGLMLIGVIVSSAYPSGQKFSLELNKPQDALGFNMTYTGSTDLTEERQAVHVKVASGSNSFEAQPVFVWSNQGLVRNPYIKKYLFYDLYISPEEIKTLSPDSVGQTLIMGKGQTETIDGYQVKFVEFDAGSHMQSGVLSIGAVLDVQAPDGQKSQIEPFFKVNGDKGTSLEPAALPGTGKNIYLLKLSADDAVIMLGVTNKDTADEFKSAEVLIIDASKRPLINFVWLGLAMVVVGAGTATYKRLKQVK